MSDSKEPVNHYKVTLKSGDSAIFPNGNHYDDYPDRLVSGIYSVSTINQTQPITPETVAVIEEVNVCPNCEKEVNKIGSFDCQHCGERIFIPVPEHNS